MKYSRQQNKKVRFLHVDHASGNGPSFRPWWIAQFEQLDDVVWGRLGGGQQGRIGDGAPLVGSGVSFQRANRHEGGTWTPPFDGAGQTPACQSVRIARGPDERWIGGCWRDPVNRLHAIATCSLVRPCVSLQLSNVLLPILLGGERRRFSCDLSRTHRRFMPRCSSLQLARLKNRWQVSVPTD